MLKVKDIALATERYGDGYECTVTFQVGDQTYNTVKAKLTPEATREVIDLAIARATSMLVVVSGAVPVAGEAVSEDAPARADIDAEPAMYEAASAEVA